MSRTVICELCGKDAPRTGATQRYCPLCSQERDLVRKRRWAHHHPRDGVRWLREVEGRRRRTEMSREAGRRINCRHRRSVDWTIPDQPLLWQVRIAVPFSYAASKNHIYALTLKKGHVALRRESRAMREHITAELKVALAGRRIAHNKVWIDMLVQKPNHKGDAVNVIDLVCDAVKDALPVDDRWFCIRRLDWEICKGDGRLIVGVGQDSDTDCQVCSYCGRIKPLMEFNLARNQPLGVGRECKECRQAGRLLAQEESTERCLNPNASTSPGR